MSENLKRLRAEYEKKHKEFSEVEKEYERLGKEYGAASRAFNSIIKVHDKKKKVYLKAERELALEESKLVDGQEPRLDRLCTELTDKIYKIGRAHV